MMYTDASVFELIPERIVSPKNQKQLLDAVQLSLFESLPLTMRAGGTSLGGQAIGQGCLIDISKHLTNVLAFTPEQKEVVVEPGVIQDDLNALMKDEGLRFAPDTSTSNRAMIGGMIGNNSCGSYSVYYGTTREHVKSVDVILSDGSEVRFSPLSEQELNLKLKLKTLEGHIYRTVIDILEKHGSEIVKKFPHPSIKRRNTGYALDVLYTDYQPANPEGHLFNLTPLICGSEGTLAIIKQATLRLVEPPKYKGIICAHFDSILIALEVVQGLLDLNPAAIELIDKATLDGTLHNLQQQQNRFWIQGDPQAVLVIEHFEEDEIKLSEKLKQTQVWLQAHNSYATPVIEGKNADKVWSVRKAGLGMLMGKVTRNKAVAVIEDAAVPVDKLSLYYQDVQALMTELGINCVYYGHASVGLIHIRPEIDLATSKGKTLFTTIARRHALLVKKYRGALSGEHGDGRIRAPFIEEQVGKRVYQQLVALKKAFDPKNMFNPGVVIGDMPITAKLRSSRQPQKKLTTGFDWDEHLSLMDAVEKCNGAGTCRKSAGVGVMCPSYQATREENFSTRGRSNLLRFALTEPNPLKALSENELHQALEMCLGCKACKSECPASVDMSRLKSEVLYQTRKSIPSLSHTLIKNYKYVLAFGQCFPRLFNRLQNLGIVKSWVGVDSRRTLPQAHAFNLESWWRLQQVESDSSLQTVWVLCDLYAQYQEPSVGKSVLTSLNKLGLNVKPIFMKSSPRALISQGLLSEARLALQSILEQLKGMGSGDLWLGIEPSEVLTWRDEAAALLSKESQRWLLKNQALLFEELILRLAEQERLPELQHLKKNVYLHVHCHQKSLASAGDSLLALQLIPGLNVKVIKSGCCGMSGEFGYKHFDTSKKIAEQSLLPALSLVCEGDLIVATGTSCRHQITGLSKYEAMHCAEVFSKVLV